MLGIFGGTQSGHPLADLKEAKRIAAALPAGEAFASLEEIAHWLESVKARPPSSRSTARSSCSSSTRPARRMRAS